MGRIVVTTPAEPGIARVGLAGTAAVDGSSSLDWLAVASTVFKSSLEISFTFSQTLQRFLVHLLRSECAELKRANEIFEVGVLLSRRRSTDKEAVTAVVCRRPGLSLATGGPGR
jgi:hypothetical protein